MLYQPLMSKEVLLIFQNLHRCYPVRNNVSLSANISSFVSSPESAASGPAVSKTACSIRSQNLESLPSKLTMLQLQAWKATPGKLLLLLALLANTTHKHHKGWQLQAEVAEDQKLLVQLIYWHILNFKMRQLRFRLASSSVQVSAGWFSSCLK